MAHRSIQGPFFTKLFKTLLTMTEISFRPLAPTYPEQLSTQENLAGTMFHPFELLHSKLASLPKQILRIMGSVINAARQLATKLYTTLQSFIASFQDNPLDLHIAAYLQHLEAAQQQLQRFFSDPTWAATTWRQLVRLQEEMLDAMSVIGGETGNAIKITEGLTIAKLFDTAKIIEYNQGYPFTQLVLLQNFFQTAIDNTQYIQHRLYAGHPLPVTQPA
jgi:hypothetical protein